MTVLGSVDPTPIAGRVHRRHVIYETVTGPSTDKTGIADGATATLDFSIASESPRDVQYAGLAAGLTGLPTGVYVTDISVDTANKKLNVIVINKSGASVDITANSVTATVLVLS